MEVGRVEALFRYPVKSMRGEKLETADLGWHGIRGDRRLAFRRVGDHSGLPWLTASKLPELVLFNPCRRDSGNETDVPTHVRTPEGQEMAVFAEDLAADIGRRYGAPVEMMQLDRGAFDDATVSVIATDTVEEISRLAGQQPDVRRFRPNVVIRLLQAVPFQEDQWLGGLLTFGDEQDAPAINVTTNDIRCSMINLHPDSAHSAPEMLKTVVRRNENKAGVYASVTRTGRLKVGQSVFLRPAIANVEAAD